MSDTLTGRTIALLATDGFEDSELTEPLEAMRNAGAEVTIITNSKDTITGKNGTEVDADASVEEVTAQDFDGLLLPGGVQNPDIMRTESDAVAFVKDFFNLHKPVAAICHAPWLLIEADVVRDRKLTSWPSLRTDLLNAGADWVDEEVVVDQKLVTSRKPEDLAAFCAKAIEEFSEPEHADQTT